MNENGFVYFTKKGKDPNPVYSIGQTQDLMNSLVEADPDEVLNVIRCSNYKALRNELFQTFNDCLLPHSQKFLLSSDQIESIHLIIRSKSQF
tara:strand:+ start:341 stop:616 length:276 start_codon:yes stop_codon:yes gene_type:complete